MQSLILLLLCCAASKVQLLPIEESIEPVFIENCGYDSCHTLSPGLNVHIVPHTHDDVGWLKTVDQYYYGSKNNIQKAGVQYILDSVIKELWEDPRRRFIYVETAFFWKWWVRQSATVQGRVHTLIRQGRLQMVGGAWSMNDEAASHYQSTVDQFTWGLRQLNQTFGACGRPHVGWQIDPFGHSREFANLLAMMGYDGLFLGRIDYQDKSNRKRNKNMEMIWRGDDLLGKSSDLFTGVLFNTYSPPPGFCFDVLCNDEPIIDDPSSPMYNVDQKIQNFLEICTNMSKAYKSNNILITMGEDFNYQDAAMWFINLDKLIEYSNLKAAKDGLNITLFYSTPNCYLKSVKDANPSLPTKQDDFFPYASDPNAYWTGYFTSRPTTKYFERQGNQYLQMVKQLQILANLNSHNLFVLNELRSAMGVMQHHDAITGTEKQHVANDYVRLLNQAIDDALIIARQALNKYTFNDATKPPIFNFKRCHLNESRCDVSENSDRFIVTIYNPLGWSVKEPIRIPVDMGSYQVFAGDGTEIKTQLVSIPTKVKDIPTRSSIATQELVFIIDLKPLSFKTLYVKKNYRAKRSLKTDYDYYTNNNDDWNPLKEPIIDRFDEKTIEDLPKSEKSPFDHDFSIRNPTLDKYMKENNEELSNTKKIPFPPVFSESNPNLDREANLDVLKDGTNDRDVQELEMMLKKSSKKHVQRKMEFPSLNEDELRMLSDEPQDGEKSDDAVIENQFYKLNIDSTNGEIKKITFPDQSSLNYSAKLYYYAGSCGDNHDEQHRSSGAYIFRPMMSSPISLDPRRTEVINGDLVKEFRVYLSPHGYINTKLYDNLKFIETEWIVGPISVDDDVGKEYIIKYATDIFNNGEFYTDSNGRQMLKRKIDFRPTWNVTLAEPVAGNYYPITNEIFINNSEWRISVLTDRSEGGSSLVEGEIEVMLHRRLLCDDAFGVGEPLNETQKDLGLVVRGNHRVLIDKDSDFVKKNVLNLHLSPIVLFSDANNIKYDEFLKLNNEFSWMEKELPNGIHLLTLEPWDSKILLRLENYLENEGNIEVDLKELLRNIKIKSVRETLLAANVWADEYQQWDWGKDSPTESRMPDREMIEPDFKIKIKSKQIRTFIVDYTFRNS